MQVPTIQEMEKLNVIGVKLELIPWMWGLQRAKNAPKELLLQVQEPLYVTCVCKVHMVQHMDKLQPIHVYNVYQVHTIQNGVQIILETVFCA